MIPDFVLLAAVCLVVACVVYGMVMTSRDMGNDVVLTDEEGAMASVLNFDQRRQRTTGKAVRMWVVKDKDIPFFDTDGSNVATLRFEELASDLYTRLTQMDGYEFRKTRCGQLVRLESLGLQICVVAIERRVVPRYLLEFQPIPAVV